MKQTTLSQNGIPLLNYASSRLSPDVFSHPVWVRFGSKQGSAVLTTVDDLMRAAKNTEEDDPGTTCQILLMCAVYQNQGGQHHNALRTTKKALALAEGIGLSSEIMWAIWGACSISIQQRNYELAATGLVDLQAVLSQKNEWILADFVGILKESLLRPVTINDRRHSDGPDDQSSQDILNITFEWMMQWGFSANIMESESKITARQSTSHTSTQGTITQSFFSVQRWQGHWHTLMLMFKGELKLEWLENNTHPATRPSSFWKHISDSLRSYLSRRKIKMPEPADLPQIPGVSILPAANESSPPKTRSRKSKATLRSKNATLDYPSSEAQAVIPVAVHLLGSFSITLQDLTIKLPVSRGLSVLKYLLLHHKQDTPREVLMDIFWPDAEPDLARNNLNVAMHNLRKAIFNVTDLPLIIYEGGAYSLSPGLQLWLDVEEFERCVKSGQRLEARNQITSAVTEYETAISLYQGDFLEQNPYEEWTVLDRERLRIAYLDTLDRLSQIYFEAERYSACRSACQLILMRDACREDAHCLLMRSYSRQGQHHLALRQYQMCAESLHEELQVEPAPETTQLYNRIRRREQI